MNKDFKELLQIYHPPKVCFIYNSCSMIHTLWKTDSYLVLWFQWEPKCHTILLHMYAFNHLYPSKCISQGLRFYKRFATEVLWQNYNRSKIKNPFVRSGNRKFHWGNEEYQLFVIQLPQRWVGQKKTYTVVLFQPYPSSWIWPSLEPSTKLNLLVN